MSQINNKLGPIYLMPGVGRINALSFFPVALLNTSVFAFMNFMLEAMQGDYLEFQGKYQAAADLYNKLLFLPTPMGEEGKVTLYLPLGRSYRELGMLKESEEAFKTFLTLKDEDAELFYEYSILKEKQGNKEDALDLIMQAYNMYKNGDKELELTQKILDRYQSFQEQLP